MAAFLAVYILRQIAAAQRIKSHPFYGKPVALLADVDKETVDANVQKYLKGYNALELHTRMGKPFRWAGPHVRSDGDAMQVCCYHTGNVCGWYDNCMLEPAIGGCQSPLNKSK